MGWTYLILAGLFEIGFSSFLKLSNGMTKLTPTLFLVGFAGLSLWLLTKAMQTIPIGTAYAVWTGIGTLGTVIIGIVLFKDTISLGRAFFLSLLIFSLIGLKATS